MIRRGILFVFLILYTVCVSSYALETPFADYRMDECIWSGFDGDVKDKSDNHFNGTSHDINTESNVSVDGVLCRIGDFTQAGTSDYVDLNNSALNNLSNFSVSVWIKTSQTNNFAILSGANSHEDNEALMWFPSSTSFAPHIKGSKVTISIPDVADNRWHHVVWTRDGGSGENCIVVDGDISGKECKVINKLGVVDIDPGGLILGQEQESVGGNFDSSQAFDGYMDEFKIFDKVLDDTQIEDIYNNEQSRKNYDGSQRECNCCLDESVISTTPLEFEGANITLHDTEDDPTWTHVDFNKSFSSVPAVFVVASSYGNHPATVRVKNITRTGFDAIMSEPQGEDGPHYKQEISFLAVNKGIHKIGRTYFEVGSIDTKKYQQSSHGQNDIDEWEKLDTIFESCKPVVVANIQTVNNETGLDIVNGSIIRSIPFMTTAVNISDNGVFLSLERSETHEGNISESETIAYMIAPANIQDSVVDDYGKTILFETIRKRDFFVGWDDICKSVNFVNHYSKIPLIAANKNSKNEQDGGWFRRCVLESEKVGFVIDEDGSGYSDEQYDYNVTYQDRERHHIEEDGGIFVFSDNIVIREEEENKNYKFDAWDVFRDVNDRNISTKIVNNEFNITIASLDDTGNAYAEFNGTVCVTVDNNTSRLIFLDQNSSTATFKINKATRDTKVHISWKKDIIENCPIVMEDNSTNSTDNFAIRPEKFGLDFNTTSFYAGVDFKIDLNATDGKGLCVKDYNETEGMSFVLDKNDSNSTCISGILFKPLNLSFVDGKVVFDSNYTEVGDINLTLEEKLGSEFAKVDADDTSKEARLIKSYSKKITFEPYRFVIADYKFERFPNQKWRYMSDVNESNITLSFVIQAQNKNGNLTKKFDKNCYSKDVQINIDTISSSSDGNVSYYLMLNGIQTRNHDKSLNDFDLNAIINASSFHEANSSKIVYALNVYREFDKSKNPLDINITDINTTYMSDSGVKNHGLKPDNNISSFYFGRVVTQDISTNQSTKSHSLVIAIYSDRKDAFVEGYKNYSLNWYYMTKDSFTNIKSLHPQKSFKYQDGGDLAQVTLNPNFNIVSSNGRVDFNISNSWQESSKAYIHIKVPKYLWYNKYHDYNDSNSSDCSSHPCFEYIYYIDKDSKNIKSGIFNGTTIGDEYNATKKSKIGVKVFR